MYTKQLKNKVSIITGAGNGIGRSIARLFAAEGAIVVVNDINMDLALEASNEINIHNQSSKNTAIAMKADVNNDEEVSNMVREVIKRFGAIDILVNNAGILYPTKIENIDMEEWDRVLDINLKGTFICSKVVIPIMKKNKWGRIINMSSSAGRSVSTIGGSHYTTAKAGVIGFTRAIAKELAPFNINVNAVCPGLVNTVMVRKTISKEEIAEYAKSFPIGRLSEPEEVADLVLFLASERSSYIIGASIDINGGDLMI